MKQTLFESIRHNAQWLLLGIFILIFGIFFYRTIFFGLLPIPTDDLVGMYHPWRDAYAHTFQNGVPFKNFLITDPVRQQIPWRKQVIDTMKAGKLPLWNATDFSGTPLLGNIQSGTWYPLNILFFIFPFATSWTLLIISQPLLAGIFLYLFLRHKRIEPLAALTGAVIFAFSGFSVSWLTWGTIGSTVLWLPLILYAFDQMHERAKKWPWRMLFIIAVASSFFAGHLQMFFYVMVFFIVYALWQMKQIRMVKMYPMHVITPLIIALIAAPVWVRFISVYMTSSRMAGTTWMSEGFFIPLKHLIQFIAPDYFGNPATLNYWGTWNYGEMVGYVGIVGLILAGVGISTAPALWIITILWCLLFAINWSVAKLPYIYHIPFLSSLQPTRLMGIIDFSLSVLAAYGLSALMKNRKKIVFAISTGVTGLVLFGLWISVLKPGIFHVPVEHIAVIKHNLILPTIIYGVAVGITAVLMVIRSSWQTMRTVGCIVLAVLLSFELIRFGWKFTPFTDPSYFFPKTEIIETLGQMKKPFRVLAVDDRLVPPNVLGFYGIESVSGYDPIYTGRYEEFIAAMERGEANIQPPFGFNRIISPKTITSPLFSLLNVYYVLSMDPISSTSVRLLAEEGTTKLYSVVHKVPRVYFADTVLYEMTKQNIMNRLYDPSFVPGQTAVIESLPFPVGMKSDTDDVSITAYAGDRVELQTTTTKSRFVVIGNMMDSHWQVTIDGEKTSLYRTNYLFFGFVVSPGTHKIKVQYR